MQEAIDSLHFYCVSLSGAHDSDCDGIIDEADSHKGADDWLFDSDGDGVRDPVDRVPNLDDYGDVDGDGYANWADYDPSDAMRTILGSLPQTIEALRVGEQEMLDQQENARLANLAVAHDVYKSYLQQDTKDSDQDGVADIYDTQPTLDYFDDQDGDSTSNGQDYWPEDPYRD